MQRPFTGFCWALVATVVSVAICIACGFYAVFDEPNTPAVVASLLSLLIALVNVMACVAAFPRSRRPRREQERTPGDG
jgi:hypothetical protein